MDKDKSEVFKSFTNKAIKRFQEKKVRKYRTLHIPSLDENIKIRNLDYPEIVECTEIEDENDPNAADKYTIYLAVVEPTRLISPFKILKSSGSSSRLVDLNSFPNLVSLISSGNKLPCSSLASVIVLNLYNVKIFSFNPGLFCLKMTGAPSFILTNNATISKTGLRIIIANNDKIKSSNLLIYFRYII